jgi:protein gp37
VKDTSIEWADNTINFHMGCTKVSEECTKCYMYRLMTRFGKDPFTVKKMNFNNIIKNLEKWNPSRIFVDSMSDFWHKDITDETITECFEIMAKFPKHQFLVLTKRAERMHDYIYQAYLEDHFPPKNIWFGVSCGIMKSKNRIELLQTLPIENIKFVSFEPLLEDIGYVDLSEIDWAIVGGESDPKPRPTNKQWVANLFQLCKVQGVAFFLKQWGGSKKCDCHSAWGCRIYEGQTWDELPNIGIAA